MDWRLIVVSSMAAFSTASPAGAQLAEPIFTRSALPNPPATVSLKLDFVTPVGQTSGDSQAVPVSTLEVGLSQRTETVLQLPLLRVSEPNGSSVLAAGQFSFALRYLLAGSPTARYAISFSGRLEVPTGDSALVGNEIQLMPTVLAEWRATPRLCLRSNLAWNTTVAGSTGRFAFLEQATALVWLARRHLMPVLEFVGSTNTLNLNSQFVLQPEAIVPLNEHLEIKAGVTFGLAAPAPRYAIRSQLAWILGRRQ